MNRWHDPVSGEHEAGERAWKLVRTAYATRERLPRERKAPRRTLALALSFAVAAGGLGAAGAAVVNSLQDDSGARTALSSVPGGGRVLLVASSGAWIVNADGSKRHLGDYEDAVWSPHGKFVAATRTHEFFALDPQGDVRWSIARRGHVRLPAWNAPDGYRVAYLAGNTLRVVAGDGTGDRVVARGVRAVRPAWRPGKAYELAYADGRGLRVVAADTKRLLWRRTFNRLTQLAWSADGTRLLAVSPSAVRVFDERGHVVGRDDPSDATRAAGAAFVGRSHKVAEIRIHGDRSDLFLLNEGRTVFDGLGRLSGVVWSPNGKWLVVAWPTANELLFIPTAPRPRKVVGFGGLGDTFGSFPELRGWAP